MNKYFLGWIFPIAFLVLWQFLGQLDIISTLLFPTPLMIAETFIDLVSSGQFFEHLNISIIRALLGFLIGGGLGLLFGVLVGLSRKTEKVVDPTFQMIRMIPHLAVAPLFILWFGIGEESKVLLIAKGAFFPLYINTYLGIRNVDHKLFEVTRILQFSRAKQITKLIIPATMPHILMGLRLSLGIAWLGLVVAELMAATSGLGYLMSDARQFGQTALVFVVIIIFAVIGKLTDSFVQLLENRLLSWRDNYQG
ncbi:ABC transporter permease [Lysinibacillus endophyticus]